MTLLAAAAVSVLLFEAGSVFCQFPFGNQNLAGNLPIPKPTSKPDLWNKLFVVSKSGPCTSKHGNRSNGIAAATTDNRDNHGHEHHGLLLLLDGRVIGSTGKDQAVFRWFCIIDEEEEEGDRNQRHQRLYW